LHFIAHGDILLRGITPRRRCLMASAPRHQQALQRIVRAPLAGECGLALWAGIDDGGQAWFHC